MTVLNRWWALWMVLSLAALPAMAAEGEQQSAAVPVKESKSAKEAKARELLQLTRPTDATLHGMDEMIAMLKKTTPQVEEETWTRIRAEINVDELIDLLVPIYVANLDEADLDALIEFYRSPVGKRFIEKQAIITRQSFPAIQEWSQRLVMKIMGQMKRTDP